MCWKEATLRLQTVRRHLFVTIAVLALGALCLFSAQTARALTFDIDLETSSTFYVGSALTSWYGPTVSLGYTSDFQADSFDVTFNFANDQFLRMIDYHVYQVDQIGYSIGGFTTRPTTSLTEFWLTLQVTLLDSDGSPLTMPPLTNNPVSLGPQRIETRDTGYVSGSGSTVNADFLSASDYANIYGLNYQFSFYSDSSLTTPVLVDFRSSASIRPNLGAHTIAIESSEAPIPEPTTLLLFGAGLAGLAGVAKKRKAGKNKTDGSA